MRSNTRYQHRDNPSRLAFTLIELLVVMALVATLVAILVPVLGSIRIRVQEGQVITEIRNLDAAVADFKVPFGIEPPSQIVLYEGGNTGSINWNQHGAGETPAEKAMRIRSRTLLTQMWPSYDFTTPIDIDRNGTTTDEFHVLTSGECLVFFLGGVPDVANGQLNGFSTNRTQPFRAGGPRIGPFFEFESNRFVDKDVDSASEYLDSLPGQRTPYAYFSSNGGTGYTVFGIDGGAGIAGFDDDTDTFTDYNDSPVNQNPDCDEVGAPGSDDEILLITGEPENKLCDIYTREAVHSTLGGKPWRESSFQIISPGGDFDYGDGGFYNGEDTGNLTPEDRDNLTNFQSGRLER